MAQDDDHTGPQLEDPPSRPTQLTKRSWIDVLKRTVKEFNNDNLTDWAAALTYYGVLSIFPGVLMIVSLLGMLSSDGQRTVQDTVQQIAPNAEIQRLVDTVLTQVRDPGTAGIAALIGLVVAFWSASGYIAAFMRASNAIYDVPEGRPI